jgi:hypothetical protein
MIIYKIVDYYKFVSGDPLNMIFPPAQQSAPEKACCKKKDRWEGPCHTVDSLQSWAWRYSCCRHF